MLIVAKYRWYDFGEADPGRELEVFEGADESHIVVRVIIVAIVINNSNNSCIYGNFGKLGAPCFGGLKKDPTYYIGYCIRVARIVVVPRVSNVTGVSQEQKVNPFTPQCRENHQIDRCSINIHTYYIYIYIDTYKP